MLPTLRTLAPFGLLIQCVAGSRDNAGDDARFKIDSTTIYDPTCTANVTVFNTTLVQKTHYIDYTVNITKTNTCFESTTITLNYTVSVTNTDTDLVTITNTDTDLVTITNTATNSTTITATDTDSVTITNTDTDAVTITTTDTDAVTITTTDTDAVTITTTDTDAVTITTTDTDSVTITETDSTTVTRTLYTTTYDPCPKSCSISAARVNLYFWPSDRPYTYPTTYVDPSLSYTFTSPSVYMFIPTAAGINTLGQRVEPSTSNWILPLDLYEVSTIAYGTNATRQLTLADLGTNCPKTPDPTAIATIDADCDPMLAAPSQVRSWAYPCNACGRFGLFDPPYAVPTVTGGLLGPSTVVVTAEPITVTAPPVVETSPPPPPPPPPVQTGALVIEYHDSEGNVVSVTTIATTGATGGTTTSTVLVLPTNTGSSGSSETGVVSPVPSETDIPEPGETIPPTTTDAPDDAPPFEETSLPTTVATAAAEKPRASGVLWWMMPAPPYPAPNTNANPSQRPNNNADPFSPTYTTCRSLANDFLASAPTASALVEYWSVNVTIQTNETNIALAYYSLDSAMSSWAATAKTKALSLKEKCETAHPIAAQDVMFRVAGGVEECVEAMRLGFGPGGCCCCNCGHELEE
ncbi:hypothetical protein B0T21DRAFT_451364 [Apiosordaria backusii]|uniref:Uncharacterized protein n=1 Tax=Apiosordaria backusii TaxID=314023 RepID=A0AA40BLY2_9PEZI|nr:hypothetical protein B0T21DRAFT_451364 [Apiosordaria backusii]